jgi:hypothetical protein
VKSTPTIWRFQGARHRWLLCSLCRRRWLCVRDVAAQESHIIGAICLRCITTGSYLCSAEIIFSVVVLICAYSSDVGTIARPRCFGVVCCPYKLHSLRKQGQVDFLPPFARVMPLNVYQLSYIYIRQVGTFSYVWPRSMTWLQHSNCLCISVFFSMLPVDLSVMIITDRWRSKVLDQPWTAVELHQRTEAGDEIPAPPGN